MDYLKGVENAIKFIVDDLNKNNGKKVICSIFVFISILLFISPGYSLLYFFESDLLQDGNIVLNLLNILIIDSILFTFVYIMGLSRGIKMSSNNEPIKYEYNTLFDIIITILLMGIISSVLFLSFIIMKIFEIDINIKLRIWIFVITTIVLSAKNIFNWIKMEYRYCKAIKDNNKAKKANREAKEENEDLPDDDDDI